MYENYHPGKEVSIRPATPKEVQNFAASVPTGGGAEQNIVDMLEDSPEVHGAFEGDNMVGGITFKDHRNIPDATDIPIMLVHPEKQGQGIGKLLFTYVIDNVNTKLLVVNPYTSEAEERFGKLGFVMDEEIDPSDPNTMIKKIRE